MKKVYLTLAGFGFIAPNIWVSKVSLETGNFLLWFNPTETLIGMFSNDISTAFIIDLLFVVLVFFIWTYIESKSLKMKPPWFIWALTMLFGMAGTLPLFLYFREIQKEKLS